MTVKIISAKYDVSTLSVDYGAMDGTHFLRTGGTIAWRLNNPENIRPASEGKFILGRSQPAPPRGIKLQEWVAVKVSRSICLLTSVLAYLPISFFNGVAMRKNFYSFYIPASYAKFAKQTGELAKVRTVAVNKGLLNTQNASANANESSR